VEIKDRNDRDQYEGKNEIDKGSMKGMKNDRECRMKIRKTTFPVEFQRAFYTSK
jgi:hypothetical protein